RSGAGARLSRTGGRLTAYDRISIHHRALPTTKLRGGLDYEAALQRRVRVRAIPVLSGLERQLPRHGQLLRDAGLPVHAWTGEVEVVHPRDISDDQRVRSREDALHTGSGRGRDRDLRSRPDLGK